MELQIGISLNTCGLPSQPHGHPISFSFFFADDPIAKRSSVPQIRNPPETKESERELDTVIEVPACHLMCFSSVQLN